MRGVYLVVVTAFLLIVLQIVGSGVVSPVGEHVKTYDSIDDGELDGTGVINGVYDSVFIWTPLILFAGMGMYGVLWYLRRERIEGGAPPPP